MSKVRATDSFIQKAKEIHQDKYDYSLVDYKQSKTKVIIICKHHGEFLQTPNNHLSGYGCPNCISSSNTSLRVRDTESFKIKANLIHKNKYDYSSSIYVSSKVEISIRCPIHGEFKQTPNSHLRGCGCPSCGTDKLTKNQDDFTGEASEVHNNFYDYSKINYKNSYTPIPIICPIHGVFKQKPSHHLSGQGCRKCLIDSLRTSLEDFIQKSNEVHLNKYDYKLVEYINNETKVKIICPDHGVFLQTPQSHLKGSGCPECSKLYSKQEVILQTFLLKCINKRVSNKASIVTSYRPSFLNGKELDLYIPSLNLAIEYNGFVYHHSSLNKSKFLDSTYKEPSYHLDKYKKCKENGIDLIHIYEFENISKWKRKLQLYIANPKKYVIKFSNQKRTETLKNLSLEFYGKSEIRKS